MTGNSKYQISFEFFPPKTTDAHQQLLETALMLSQCAPQFFSVTFGAGGSTREGTVTTVELLQQKINHPVAPHLACIGMKRSDILHMLEIYKKLNVNRLIVLRGDLPSGMGEPGEIKFASELVELIRNATGNRFYLSVAAYPEIHPQAKNVEDDVLNLKRKYLAGADNAITQYFFNPDAYFYYLDECAKQQIHLPIIPGIMPIMQFNKLARFSDNCGAEIPRWIRKRLEDYGDDIASIQAFGLEIVCKLCERLLAGGAPGLHFYTLNKAELSMQILKLLNLSLNQEKVLLVNSENQI